MARNKHIFFHNFVLIGFFSSQSYAGEPVFLSEHGEWRAFYERSSEPFSETCLIASFGDGRGAFFIGTNGSETYYIARVNDYSADFSIEFSGGESFRVHQALVEAVSESGALIEESLMSQSSGTFSIVTERGGPELAIFRLSGLDEALNDFKACSSVLAD